MDVTLADVKPLGNMTKRVRVKPALIGVLPISRLFGVAAHEQLVFLKTRQCVADGVIMARRSGSFLLALGVATISGFAALTGTIWGFGLKCDDSCSALPGWREDPGAWQWNALGLVPIGGFILSLVLVASVGARRRTLAYCALATWGPLAVAFLTLLKDSGLTSHPGQGWLGFAAVLIAGLAAIALTPAPQSG